MISGYLRHEGIWISPSTVYRVLKGEGLVEKSKLRQAPWKFAKYDPWQRNFMWGTDFTYIRINDKRHYLTTVIDFYSRYIIAYGVLERITNSEVKGLIDIAVNDQKKDFENVKPIIRSDQGSQYIAYRTKKHIKDMKLIQSFTRTYRPTDNARTERWYRSFKQECHYIFGNYPSIDIARDIISRYITDYNQRRPHAANFGFTPYQAHYVYETKSEMMFDYRIRVRDARLSRVRFNGELTGGMPN